MQHTLTQALRSARVGQQGTASSDSILNDELVAVSNNVTADIVQSDVAQESYRRHLRAAITRRVQQDPDFLADPTRFPNLTQMMESQDSAPNNSHNAS